MALSLSPSLSLPLSPSLSLSVHLPPLLQAPAWLLERQANLLVSAMERAQELEKLNATTVKDPSMIVEEDRGPRPHRCNDRLEDFVQALFEGDPRINLPGPAKLFWRCYKSKPGEEPNDPFFFLEEDANGKLVPKGRR